MKTATKERPILFSGPMVRAILSGAKTQTRRIVKDSRPPSISESGYIKFLEGHPLTRRTGDGFYWCDDTAVHGAIAGQIRCPYGKVGDRLWVRETWRRPHCNASTPITQEQTVAYRASWDFHDGFGDPWRPSIHMPRWASRITLEITDVRVQRLQEISVKEVFAEGVQIPVSATGSPMLQITGKCSPHDYLPEGAIEKGTLKLKDQAAYIRAHFASLWDTINGKGSWDANPWVWALSFRRVES